MRPPQKPQRPGWLATITGEVLAVFGQFLITPIFLGYFLMCFWVFDRFHVSNPDTQLAWVLAPVFISGFWLAHRMIRKSWGD